VWQDRPYDSKSDLWSIGCVLYEMLALNPPFQARDMKGLYTKVLAGKYNPIPSNYSKDMSLMVKACL